MQLAVHLVQRAATHHTDKLSILSPHQSHVIAEEAELWQPINSHDSTSTLPGMPSQ